MVALGNIVQLFQMVAVSFRLISYILSGGGAYTLMVHYFSQITIVFQTNLTFLAKSTGLYNWYIMFALQTKGEETSKEASVFFPNR